MTELQNIKAAVNPAEILLVIDAMIGQDAVNAATAFDDALDVTGVMLSKLDGDAPRRRRAVDQGADGQAHQVRRHRREARQIEPFHPDRMARRILGMGDVLTLIEKAEQHVDEEKAKKLRGKLKKNRFTSPITMTSSCSCAAWVTSASSLPR